MGQYLDMNGLRKYNSVISPAIADLVDMGVSNKNLVDVHGNNGSYGGVTATVRNDGGIELSTVAGGATNSFSLYFTGNNFSEVQHIDTEGFNKEKVILSGTPDDTNDNRIILGIANNGTWVYSFSSLSGAVDLSSYTYNQYYVYIPIVSGKSYNGIWYPMLCYESLYTISPNFIKYNHNSITNTEIDALWTQ